MAIKVYLVVLPYHFVSARKVNVQGVYLLVGKEVRINVVRIEIEVLYIDHLIEDDFEDQEDQVREALLKVAVEHETLNRSVQEVIGIIVAKSRTQHNDLLKKGSKVVSETGVQARAPKEDISYKVRRNKLRKAKRQQMFLYVLVIMLWLTFAP